MPTKVLNANFDLLCEEYVLVQAWKKTSAYIRYRNWFSDTLELDLTTVNLPRFLSKLRERLKSPEPWRNGKLRIVPAPKRQPWRVCQDNGVWEPTEEVDTGKRLRPLAHVNLEDQVLATAVMLCLADRVETAQGDTRTRMTDVASQRSVVSYGNRLFCDQVKGGQLRHRWGSSKLYRSYFQDYQAFLKRPTTVINRLLGEQKWDVFVVHSDLRQFYDRVHPKSLARALDNIRRESDDQLFFDFAKILLNWSWDSRDEREVNKYTKETDLHDFSRVALPQGLVAAGFFANVVLLAFDAELQKSIGNEIGAGIFLADACRYVDDLRLTVAVDLKKVSTNDINQRIKDELCNWLSQLLEEQAPGLLLSESKTSVFAMGARARPLVLQSKKMKRIQSAVSGGFDALGGGEILDAIHGLLGTQQVLERIDESAWPPSPVPDVRDETVYRFAAARFRSTFRSIRPLLDDDERVDPTDSDTLIYRPTTHSRGMRTQRQLDNDARAFALRLIQRWVEDPSNVRLLRIGLDLWPHSDVLRQVLNLLQPFTETASRSRAQKRIGWYCLSEVLRAGATETGIVEDGESLPSGIDLTSYRNVLCDEALRLIDLSAAAIPWYLRQQALLFVAAYDPTALPFARKTRSPETRHYWNIIRFLRDESDGMRSADLATIAIVARRAFVTRQKALELTQRKLTPSLIRHIADADPSFLLELIPWDDPLSRKLPPRVRDDFAYFKFSSRKQPYSLAALVVRDHPISPLRNELSLLRFAVAFLQAWRELESPPHVVTPTQVVLSHNILNGVATVDKVIILPARLRKSGSLYQPPTWCTEEEKWRFQLGFLLRFILSGHPDFTRPVRHTFWKDNQSSYRPANSHWYQRLYGLFNGQPAFGDDWLPITDWTERFLLALLAWPGCRKPDGFDWVQHGLGRVIANVLARISALQKRQGSATGELILPMTISRPTTDTVTRPLHACVVQTVVPTDDDFFEDQPDFDLNDPVFRKRHRNHLSSALAAVERMLDLRQTHTNTQQRLDLLILPELATHPVDVRTHLIPFARAHKTIILTGLTYERIRARKPLVNSALWIIPEWSDVSGLQIRTRRQGKAHLAPTEQALNNGMQHILGFRRCQWLVGYPWSEEPIDPLWLTAAVCYDATDLRLAADLRHQSDVFIIPALNKDVTTFDHLALALHYHMFQLVVVANNGKYGGSNAYWPKRSQHQKQIFSQIFHMHGQPQASIAFLEINDIGSFLQRRDNVATDNNDWKSPPAGLTSSVVENAPR